MSSGQFARQCSGNRLSLATDHWITAFLYSSLMPKFERHIFICGNVRPAGHPRGCCDPTGRAELQKLFKQKLAERGLKGRVRANQSGCLDQCEHGPNLVVYPEAVWYGGVTLADVDEIVESHIVGGRPVERLRIKEDCLNTASCEHRAGAVAKAVEVTRS